MSTPRPGVAPAAMTSALSGERCASAGYTRDGRTLTASDSARRMPGRRRRRQGRRRGAGGGDRWRRQARARMRDRTSARARAWRTEDGHALGVGPARVRRLAGGRGRAADAAEEHGVGARAGGERGGGQVLAAGIPGGAADERAAQRKGVAEARAHRSQPALCLRTHLRPDAVAGAHADLVRRGRGHARREGGRARSGAEAGGRAAARKARVGRGCFEA